MIKPNPFTPKSGLEPKVFINRDKEIGFFLKRIDEAGQGSINHYIINGAWGSGKRMETIYLDKSPHRAFLYSENGIK